MKVNTNNRNVFISVEDGWRTRESWKQSAHILTY